VTAVIQQISNADYHADTSVIGSSGLKLLRTSPRHFWADYIDPDRVRKDPTEAMEFGTLVHALVLEPETVKEVSQTLSNKVLKSFDVAEKVAQAVRAHPAASLIVRKIGAPEFTIYWEENVRIPDGRVITVKCKARLDWAVTPQSSFPAGLILDLKTTKDASLDEFPKSAYNLGYHIQAAWYARAMQMVYGVEGTPFLFLAAEKSSPFGVMTYKAKEDFMRAGWDNCQKLLQTYAQCLTDGVWPCYPETIQELNLPRWAKENYV